MDNWPCELILASYSEAQMNASLKAHEETLTVMKIASIGVNTTLQTGTLVVYVLVSRRVVTHFSSATMSD